MVAKARVVIVTRTKDRDLLLRRALESIESQTYQDFIHVIVNDGGDREALEAVLNEYPAKNRVIINNKQPNMIKALNIGIQAADSEYIAILDDDDTWAPERLEKTIPYLDQTGAKAAVVKMNIVIEEMRDGQLHKISEELHPQSGEGEISLFKQCYQNYLSNGIITYRREVYEELGGYDETLETAEDWDFGIRLMLKYDVDFLRNEKPLFFYHQRPRQKGAEGNSVHAGVNQQEKTITVLRNKYLRDDLIQGKLGAGYIMNLLVHDSETTVRLEGHINRVGEAAERNVVNALKHDIANSQLSTKVMNKARSVLGSKNS
jgi:glycosyltransferase involved in cell wall biosynthesis